MPQACLRPRDRFWDIPVPKIYHEVEDTLGESHSWGIRPGVGHTPETP
ncbi:hypothetical protein [Thiolapillus sp.]